MKGGGRSLLKIEAAHKLELADIAKYTRKKNNTNL
jgi:hypothetical protein